MNSNIVLIGFRGAGKSTIASALSKKLNMEAINTDIEIEKKSGNSISEYVKKSGWESFRNIESEIVGNIKNKSAKIIDCGGGIIERESNIKNLKSNGVVFWLNASQILIKERIKNTNRPSLTGKNFVKEVDEILLKRAPAYKSSCDFEIAVDGKSVEEICNEILSKLNAAMLCTVITSKRFEGCLNKIQSVKSKLVELRLDLIEDINRDKLKRLIGKAKKSGMKVIVTERVNEKNKNLRLDLINSAIENNADFIDVELGVGEGQIRQILENRGNSKIIISHHDFEKTPDSEELEQLHDKIKNLNPDLIKIAAFANSINDNFRIFELLKEKNNLIALCMGVKGQISRILASKFGSRISYASLKKGKESAEGQMAAEELENTFNFSSINPDTKVIGIIGEFAENSMSKHMHNPSFRQKNLDYVYVPFKVAPNELEEFMQNFRKFDFHGAGVTIPHKEEIIKHLDILDSTAKKIGAVNSLLNKDGEIIGFNTDYFGAVEALKEKIELKNKKMLIIGAGGAARAIAFGLKEEGAIITITNRTFERAKKLAEEFKLKICKFEDIKDAISQSDIIINATNVGMSINRQAISNHAQKPKVFDMTPNTDNSIISEDDLAPGKILMDIVYKPAETKLIRMARKAGCIVITGDRMLLFQAIKQFEIWTGEKPDIKFMEKNLLSKLR